MRLTLAAPLALFAAFWLPGCANDTLDGSAQGLPADRIVLFITGGSNGTLEPCECPSQPPGGLSRRKLLIDSLRKQWGADAILLDNGNNLSMAPDPLRDRYMLAGLAKLHYDAINVGDQELDRGPKNFTETAKGLKLPVVTSNVRLADRSWIGQGERDVYKNGHVVSVYGLLGPKKMRYSSPAVREAIDITDPGMSVKTDLAMLADKRAFSDVVVALAAFDSGERDDLVAPLAGHVDLVVLSTEQDKPVQLEHIGAVPVVYAPAGGKQIAVVVLAKQRSESGRPYRVVRVKGYPVAQSLPRDRELWAAYQEFLAEARKPHPPAASQPGGAK